MRRLVVALSLATLSACGTAPPTEVPAAPQVAVAAPAPEPEPPEPDTCGARPLQSLIGRPRTEIPVPVRPELQRVMCTTCPATMDYNLNRLNFLFDARTGLIREIRCG